MDSRYYEGLLARFTGMVSKTTIGEVLTERGEPFSCGCSEFTVRFFFLPNASRLWGTYYHAVATVCDSDRHSTLMEELILELDTYIGIVDEDSEFTIAS